MAKRTYKEPFGHFDEWPRRYEPIPGTIEELPGRAYRCIKNYRLQLGLDELATREEVRLIYPRLVAGAKDGKLSMMNFGRKSLRAIEDWLGLSPEARGSEWVQCPTCGHRRSAAVSEEPPVWERRGAARGRKAGA